jgi:hypothetical protein
MARVYVNISIATSRVVFRLALTSSAENKYLNDLPLLVDELLVDELLVELAAELLNELPVEPLLNELPAKPVDELADELLELGELAVEPLLVELLSDELLAEVPDTQPTELTNIV